MYGTRHCTSGPCCLVGSVRGQRGRLSGLFRRQGRVGSGREVLCKVDINKANTNLVADLSKGTKINCSGTIKSYVKFVGTVVLIDDAKIE